ncbi:hypothetical protein BD769DRAFT_1668238 [Suillus cothurnatus]|nr:hypothetical protein BD769DRAFT_1668238 [Suillus cothurnatus]
MPHIPGQWFPQADEGELFYASMLALLQPWQSIIDIKHHNDTFTTAYAQFITDVPESIIHIISNIQYFHECADKAKTEHEKTCALRSCAFTSINEGDHIDDELEDINNIGGEDKAEKDFITDDDILDIMEQSTTTWKMVYADVAMNIAQEFNFFTNDTYHSVIRKTTDSASEDDLQKSITWECCITESTSNEVKTINGPLKSTNVTGSVEMNNAVINVHPRSPPSVTLSITDQHFLPVQFVILPPSHLNKEQALAFRIVSCHVIDLLQGKNPPHLLMVIHGQGGTGKTCLLHTITALFGNLGCAHRLAKTALTGITASQIGGKTLHSWATIPAKKGFPWSDNWIFCPMKETAKHCTANMQGKWMLATNEMSLLMTEVLWLLSQVLTAFHAGEGITFIA